MTAVSAARSGAPIERVRARPMLGTVVEIAAGGTDGGCVHDAIEQAFSEVALVHRLMSFQHADSDVSHLNRRAARHPVCVHPHTWKVLRAARRLSEASAGLFDITVAGVLARLGLLPRHAGICAAGDGDWQDVELYPDYCVRFRRPVCIDVSGIAKGYAVDCAIHALLAAGMTAGRVNAGGDLRVFGIQPQTIHVRHPDDPVRVLPLVQLREGSVATSAGYFSERVRQGARAIPLIHPLHGKSCEGSRSVTVLARNCATADALTKVVHCDCERALPVLARFEARAVVLEGAQGMKFFDASSAERVWQIP